MNLNIPLAVDSVIFVDDKKAEVEEFIKEMKGKGFYVEYLNPNKDDGVVKSTIPDPEKTAVLKNGNLLVILDIFFKEGIDQTTALSQVRKILSILFSGRKNTYGIAIWSKHSRDTVFGETGNLENLLKEKIENDVKDSAYPAPLFIITLDNKTKKGNEIWKMLCEEINKNNTASFYYKWSEIAKTSVSDAFGEFNKMLSKYKYKDRDKLLSFLLSLMAINYTGINPDFAFSHREELCRHSFSAMSDIVADRMNSLSSIIDGCNILKDYKPEMFRIERIDGTFSYIDYDGKKMPKEQNDSMQIQEHIGQLNCANLFDFNKDYAKDKILPGNIYRQPPVLFKSFMKKIKDGIKITKVLFEMTPPCNAAHTGKGNGHAKFIEGFFILATDAKEKNLKNILNSGNYYKEIGSVYIKLNNKENLYRLILDFDSYHSFPMNKLKINLCSSLFVCRASGRLLADVLQKYSSYVSRIGINSININH